MKLLDYAWNSYSQYGEDGIINQMLKDLHIGVRGSCGEFGAADGFFVSNTASLWMAGWNAILVESDEEKFALLEANTESYPNVTAENAAVYWPDNHFQNELDVLSMDVDGNEWYIWQRMNVRHRILVVECNSTVPPHIEMVGPEDTLTGSSALSLVKLGEQRGYKLVAMTDTNCIFVRDEDYWAFEEYDTDLEDIFVPSHLNYIITSYVGDYEFVGTFPYGMVQEKKLT